MCDAIFESRRLRCRRLIAPDTADLFAVYSDPIGARWVDDGLPIAADECEQWYHITQANYVKRGYGMFALADLASDQVVGFCGLVHPGGQPEAEIKYAFLRSHWGMGLATEAATALLAYGAAEHGLDQIIATVAEQNLASQRVLAKAGMALIDRREHPEGVTLVFEWLSANAA